MAGSLSGSTKVTVAKDSTGAIAQELFYNWTGTQDIANNKTTVSWNLVLKSYTYGAITSSAPKAWSVTTNGTTKTGTCYIGIGNNSSKTLASGTQEISHNADGSKSFSFSFSCEFSMTFAGVWYGTISGSGSGQLKDIPRASSISASNCTLGSSTSITITKATAAFRHTLTYTCGSASGTITLSEDSTLSKSFSWTPPLSLSTQNTTGTSVSITYTLKTYSNSNKTTQIGSAVTKTVTGTIPASVKPTVTAVTVSGADTASSGHLTKYGGYVQGQSKVKVAVTASKAQNSDIKSYSVQVDGKTYTSTVTAISTTVTSAVLSGTGSLKAKATATDARSRTSAAVESTAFTVLAYSVPQITYAAIHRCDQNGTESMIGAYCIVEWAATITSLNSQNSATVKLMYKKTTDSTWTTVTTSGGSTFGLSGSYIFAADIESPYNVKIVVTDDFGPKEWSQTLSTAQIPIHLGEKAIAFGKTIEDLDVFDVGFNVLRIKRNGQPSLAMHRTDNDTQGVMYLWNNGATDPGFAFGFKAAGETSYTYTATIGKSLFRPYTNEGSSLGSSAYQWKGIYGETIYENGTSLANKYAPKLSVIANESNLNWTGGTTVASGGDWKTLGSYTFGAGSYIIFTRLRIGGNTSGTRRFMWATANNNTTTWRENSYEVVQGCAGWTNCQSVFFAATSSSTTRYLRFYQDSGSALAVYVSVQIIKIA